MPPRPATLPRPVAKQPNATPRPKQPKKKPWCLKGTMFLLTFPHCTATKEYCLDRLRLLFNDFKTSPSPTVAVVGQERHADGSLHLHVALKFEVEFESHISSFFDFLTGKRGNYKPVDSWKKTVLYCTKEDTDPSLYGLSKTQLLSMKAGPRPPTKSTIVAQQCMEKLPLKEIAKRDPGYFMMHQAKITKFHFWINAPMNSTPPPWPGITYRGSHSPTMKIVRWVQDNLFQERPFKSPQLYIHGPANSGKTSFVLSLKTWTRIYDVPQFEDFYDLYDDDHDLIFFDEFKAQKKVQWLNMMLAGGSFTLAIKQSQYPKHRNLPFIIASNFSPRDAYKNISQEILDTLTCRLLVVDLTSAIDHANIHFCQPTPEELAALRRPPLAPIFVAATAATTPARALRHDEAFSSQSSARGDMQAPPVSAITAGAIGRGDSHALGSDDACHSPALQAIIDGCNEALCPLCSQHNSDCRCPERQPPQSTLPFYGGAYSPFFNKVFP